MILKEGNINVEDAILKRLIDKKPVLITVFFNCISNIFIPNYAILIKMLFKIDKK